MPGSYPAYRIAKPGLPLPSPGYQSDEDRRNDERQQGDLQAGRLGYRRTGRGRRDRGVPQGLDDGERREGGAGPDRPRPHLGSGAAGGGGGGRGFRGGGGRRRARG